VLRRNDGPSRALRAAPSSLLVHLTTGRRPPSRDPVSLPAGPAAAAWSCRRGSPRWDRAGAACPRRRRLAAHGCDPGGGDCVLNATLVDAASGAGRPGEPQPARPAKATKPFLSPDPAVAARAVSAPAHAGDPIGVTVRCSAPALFVTLTTLPRGTLARTPFSSRQPSRAASSLSRSRGGPDASPECDPARDAPLSSLQGSAPVTRCSRKPLAGAGAALQPVLRVAAGPSGAA